MDMNNIKIRKLQYELISHRIQKQTRYTTASLLYCYRTSDEAWAHMSLGGKQRTQHHKNTQRRKRCSFKQKQNRPQGGTAEPYRQQQFSYLCGCIIHKTFKISCCPWAEICIQYCARNQMPAGTILDTKFAHGQCVGYLCSSMFCRCSISDY